MKKLITLTLALFLPLLANAANFKEGTHYEVLPLKATNKPEVVEYFSFFCPHCYQFETVIDELKKGLNPAASFSKSHVSFMPHGNKEVQDAIMRAFASAELLKAEDKIMPALFKAIHVEKKKMKTAADVRQVFFDNGITAKKLDSAWNSFMAEGKIAQMIQAQTTMKVRGVPSIIVNGKYRVKGGVNGTPEYIQLVNYLTTLK